MNEWMNDWMNEWMNEWMNKWMNEWMIEWMNSPSAAHQGVTWPDLTQQLTFCGAGVVARDNVAGVLEVAPLPVDLAGEEEELQLTVRTGAAGVAADFAAAVGGDAVAVAISDHRQGQGSKVRLTSREFRDQADTKW
jgi:hypothetical protein